MTFPTTAQILVGQTSVNILTNKTLTNPVISTISNTGTLTLPTLTDTLVGRITSDTLANKTLTAPSINDPQVTVASNLMTFPTTAQILVGQTSVNILTNKTLTNPVISTISNTGTLTLPTTTDTLVGRITTDILTNKTLTAPSINDPQLTVASNLMTFPTTTQTLVGQTSVNTLTNKTITGTSNIVRSTQLATTTSDVVISSSAVPAIGDCLIATSTTTAVWASNNLFAIIRDEKATNTAGGGSTASTWVQRSLNTISISNGTWVTLGTNTFTLSAGKYYITASAPARQNGNHKIRLFNVTNSTSDIIGGNQSSTTATGNDASLSGFVTPASAITYQLDHYSSSSQATTGFGVATNATGIIEVYTTVTIFKIY